MHERRSKLAHVSIQRSACVDGDSLDCVAVEAAYADEGNMMVDDRYDLESEMVSDEGNTDQSDMQRSVTSITEDIDDEMFS